MHRDSYVEVEKAFYEAPPELIGREVRVRWDGRCVKIFNERMEQVGMHTRQEPAGYLWIARVFLLGSGIYGRCWGRPTECSS